MEASTSMGAGRVLAGRSVADLSGWVVGTLLGLLSLSAAVLCWRRLAGALCQSFQNRRPEPYEAWALGRLGARVPFYGPADQVVDRQAAESWIEQLLARGPHWSRDETLATVELARRSGDRVRDIDETLRERVLDALQSVDADDHLIELVRDGGRLRPREQALVFGESLPAALRSVT